MEFIQAIRIILSLSLVIAVWHEGGWAQGIFALVVTIRFELEQYVREIDAFAKEQKSEEK